MSTEYVDDVPYVRHFIADLAPARLRLIAALEGVAPPPAEDFDYCELGCAHGDTLAALAAANPEGRFLGIDLSAAHVASAKKLARDGALENVGFLERDFEALLDDDIGEFDYVVAHGVLSWVSADKRKALIEFAHRKLKPGGLLFVSYNAMPGWAAVEPLRQLLLFPSGAGGSSLDRARSGLAFAQSMLDAKAEYFAKNPSAVEMLETMTKAGLPYVVHEYLHEHWVPMYFARVAWEMAASGLAYVGSQPAHQAFRELALPATLEKSLASITDRISFESLKDFAINEFFRRDVFVRGDAVRSAAATEAYFEATSWGTTAHSLPEGRTVKLPHRTASLEAPIYQAVFDVVSSDASTLASLVRNPALAGFSPADSRDALLRLAATDQVLPMVRATRASPPNEAGRFAVPLPYNQMMLRRLSTNMPVIMASVPCGTAFPITPLEALAIRVITEVGEADREEWIRSFVGGRVLRLRVGERLVEDRDEQRRAIGEAVTHVRRHQLTKLLELGILAPAE
ncbi:Methyltransferase [Labilithrix luteola]|uniref:Methyltransferase n=1 Tax=Labilithrix luteola TaxID=1391654 RepID=A0A0K1Q2Z5_9BACT|nr:class I SAM-dependent methyltransferase [Labilithrix luteola]AKU99744.1 Methyltransferase [Labilithrix luteola]